jgi:hypothetical protein
LASLNAKQAKMTQGNFGNVATRSNKQAVAYKEANQMSTTCTTYPIVAATVKAEDILGPNRQWQAKNTMQERYLVKFFSPCRDEVGIPEIESIASWKAEVINQFLRERGFSIQLEEEEFDPLTFGVASVLDLLVEWMVEGTVTTVMTPSRDEYPGVRIDGKGVSFFTSPNHSNPIVRVHTKSGDKVYMTIMDNPPDGFELVARAEELSANLETCWDYGNFVFPMVDLNQEVDITWVLDMETTRESTGQRAWITQALQQTKLKMNEKGARVKSAVAMAVTLACIMPKPDHVINRPFLVWFERDGLSRPLFVGHITMDDWKNPGDLQDM